LKDKKKGYSEKISYFTKRFLHIISLNTALLKYLSSLEKILTRKKTEEYENEANACFLTIRACNYMLRQS